MRGKTGVSGDLKHRLPKLSKTLENGYYAERASEPKKPAKKPPGQARADGKRARSKLNVRIVAHVRWLRSVAGLGPTKIAAVMGLELVVVRGVLTYFTWAEIDAMQCEEYPSS